MTRRTQAEQHGAHLVRYGGSLKGALDAGKVVVIDVPPKHSMSIVWVACFGAPSKTGTRKRSKKAARTRRTR